MVGQREVADVQGLPGIHGGEDHLVSDENLMRERGREGGAGREGGREGEMGMR